MTEDVDRPKWIADVLARSATVDADAAAGLDLARDFGWRLPQPGAGGTRLRWSVLADVARIDLAAGRILEAHSDALAILAEAGRPAEPGTWGVFAAEAPGVRLIAERDGDGWYLSGTKPWCSLGDRLDRALVTAHVDGARRLFAVDLRDPSAIAAPATGWVARGLPTVTSGPVTFDRTPAVPIRANEWYLDRPGFAWGGLGVAACWSGGAAGVVDVLTEWAGRHRDDPIAMMHLGRADIARQATDWALDRAAELVDSGAANGAAGAVLALQVRSIAAVSVETVLRSAGHALGPAPLAFDEPYARRVADLELYVRQHHGERDLAALGSARLESGLESRLDSP